MRRAAKIRLTSVYRAALLGLLLSAILLAQQNRFKGSVPAGTVSPTRIPLTLGDAIHRGLRTNLGLLVSNSSRESTRGERLQSLSALLPQVSSQVSQVEQQRNLKTLGLSLQSPVLSLPTIVGPFHYTDARAYVTFSAFNYGLYKSYRATRENERAAELSVQDARDLVVQAVANAYLLVIAGSSRLDALRAEVEADQAIYERTADQKRSGTAAAIDVLRSQVQLQQEQQQLLAQSNQLAKDKLALARVIGLPAGQDFTLVEPEPYSPLAPRTPEQALGAALDQRADYQSAQARVRAAQESVKAARAERYPNVTVGADYGVVGPTLSSSHGTFTLQAAVKFNIFDGGRISGDIVRTQAALKQRQDELSDLRGQIDYQVRSALFDIQSAADQVSVATNNLDLANQTLTQARDRFSAGVGDNIEVVQAQASVATANDNLISALYFHNLAKVELARALGSTEQQIQQFLEVK